MDVKYRYWLESRYPGHPSGVYGEGAYPPGLWVQWYPGPDAHYVPTHDLADCRDALSRVRREYGEHGLKEFRMCRAPFEVMEE